MSHSAPTLKFAPTRQRARRCGAAMVKRLFVVCSQKENYFELFSKILLKSGEAIEVDQAPWMDIEVRTAPHLPCAATSAL